MVEATLPDTIKRIAKTTKATPHKEEATDIRPNPSNNIIHSPNLPNRSMSPDITIPLAKANPSLRSLTKSLMATMINKIMAFSTKTAATQSIFNKEDKDSNRGCNSRNHSLNSLRRPPNLLKLTQWILLIIRC